MAGNEGPVKTPWGKSPAAPQTSSLRDVMSEQFAADLQEREDHLGAQDLAEPGWDEAAAASYQEAAMAAASLEPASQEWAGEGADTISDWKLAQLLQREENVLHDKRLAREEQARNGGSKVRTSYELRRRLHPAEAAEEEEEEEDRREAEAGDRDHQHWTSIGKNSQLPTFSRKGLSRGSDGQLVSKHDAELTGRRNANRVMENFGEDFRTGDGEGLSLPNAVYNNLKRHAHSSGRRALRLHEKKQHSTAEGAVDETTRTLMMKLVNMGLLSDIGGAIATGKESVVFHAHGGSDEEALVPAEVVLKVYKTTLSDFKTRERYVKGDYRFTSSFSHQNPRKVIKEWAAKEMLNLMKMRTHGVPCPDVIKVRDHVLIMSFLGAEGQAAPQLREARLSAAQLARAYREAVEMMVTLYQRCKLVHADLSEYNLLWHEERLWVIDVSQAVDLSHPEALEFLLRDCQNVCKFFEKSGVADVMSSFELFNHVTGLGFSGEGRTDFLSQVREKKQRPMEVAGGVPENFGFDFHWEKSLKDRLVITGSSDEEEEEEESISEEEGEQTEADLEEREEERDGGEEEWVVVGKKKKGGNSPSADKGTS